MKLISFIFSLVSLISGSAFALDLASQVHFFKLSNGMRWIVLTRPQIPVFSGIVMVRAGGMDEPSNKTGLAHMFEHMAFKGSKDIGTKNFSKEIPILEEISKLGQEMAQESQKEKPDVKKISELKKQIQQLTGEEYKYMVKNEVWETLSRKGAENLNAFTTKDVTAFHASMPINQFSLWAYVTSEMVFYPAMREFYQERDVVMEERRLRYDNNAHGFMWEALAKEAYPQGPYAWSPIGSWKDLIGLTKEDALEFHKRYYVPENMVGVIVGDITPEGAKPELERFFGRVPARQLPKENFPSSLAFQGEKRKTISFPAEPYLLMAFHKPKAPARQDYIFDMLDGLLCEGLTSRLEQKLVKTQKIATSVDCSGSFPGSRLDNLFIIMAAPVKGTHLEALETTITEELEKIATDIQPKELEKVRQSVVYNFLWGLQDNLQLAEQLATSEAVLKDWRYVANYPKIIQSITKEEIQKVAKEYFKPENRIVVYRVRGKR